MIDTKDVQVVKTQATKAYNAAQEIVITSPVERATAADHLSKMKTVAKMIKERKEAITKPLSEALNSARDLFKPIESNLADAEALMKRKMLDYDAKVEREAQVEQDKIAKKLEEGKISEKTAIKKMEAVPEVQTTVHGKVGTTTTKSIKKVQITPLSELSKEYGDLALKHLMVAGYIVWNETAVRAAALRGEAFHGVKVYEEKVISAR